MAETFLSQLFIDDNRVESERQNAKSVYHADTRWGQCAPGHGSKTPTTRVPSVENSASDDETNESSDDDDDEEESGSPVEITPPELFDEDAETFSDEMIKGCESLFGDEDVSAEVLCVADVIAEALKVADHEMTDGYALATVAATSVYIASHFSGHPKSRREVARELAVEEYLISSLYVNIYDDKENLVDLFGNYDEDGALEDLDPFSWPPLRPEITNN